MNYFVFVPAAFLVISVIVAIRAVKKGTKARRAVVMQMLSFLFVAVVSFAVPMCASAAENTPADEASPIAATTQAAAADNSKGMGLLAAALVTGISGIGGGIAVAAAAPAAIGATSEDPKNFGKAMIFVALGEGIALYGLLVSILILAKV